MTCIAGLLDGGTVYIGADSAGVSHPDLTVRADEKVFVNGEFVMGFTSSFRMGQLLRYSLKVPKPREGVDRFAFMVTDFIEAVRDTLKAGGWATTKDGADRGGKFLVGWRGALYVIDLDYQVGQPADPFAAIGSGESYALGSLHATASSGWSPEQRVLAALAAAERFSSAVRGPFKVLSAPAAPSHACATKPARDLELHELWTRDQPGARIADLKQTSPYS